MILKKKWILIGVAIVAVAILLTGGLPLLSITANTSGVGYYFRGVRGGSNENGGGDLLDVNAYVTSWTGGGQSEKIMVQGHYYCSGGFDPMFERYWYKATFSVDNQKILVNGVKTTTYTTQKWGNPPTTTGQWLPMEAITLTVTEPCSGTVNVELYGHIHYMDPLPKEKDALLAVDEAYLKSGVGRVQVTDDVVEEGTDASFYVETGYSHSERPEVGPSDEGWFLNIYNPTGTSVWQKTVADNFAGTVKWPVPDGAYSPTSTNVYRIILRNVLLDQDDDWFFTVGQGMKNQTPEKPEFQLIDGEAPFVKGESITIRMTADQTVNPIGGWWVWVSYETSAGATTEYLINEKWYAALKDSSGSFFADVTFTFPDAGNARLEASTVDSLNLNSGIAECTFDVQGFDGGGGPPPVSNSWIWVIMGVLVLVGAVLAFKMVPKPYGYFVVLLLVALAIYLIWTGYQGVTSNELSILRQGRL